MLDGCPAICFYMKPRGNMRKGVEDVRICGRAEGWLGLELPRKSDKNFTGPRPDGRMSSDPEVIAFTRPSTQRGASTKAQKNQM